MTRCIAHRIEDARVPHRFRSAPTQPGDLCPDHFFSLLAVLFVVSPGKNNNGASQGEKQANENTKRTLSLKLL